MSKRDQILEAALILFIENGFEKTPTSAISKAAGVATGTLFHHFKTKEDLINALYLDVKFALLENLAPHVGADKDLQDKFYSLWFNMIEWVMANPQRFMFMAQFGESAHIANSTREKVEEAFGDAQALFAQGIAEGVFPELPLDLLMSLGTSHLFASCNFFIQQPELWQNQKVQQQVFDSFWRLHTKAD